LPYRPKPHQSPAWSIKGGSANVDIPVGPTMWEKFLVEEELEEDSIRSNNTKVLLFIQVNLEKYYIPTRILKMYNMDWE
jgi:hypothetical protein